MKIIHCADLHLDSKMTSNLSKEQAKERKMEILRTYSRMIEYAKNNDVKAIIIAGDLFDTRNVSATARNLVKDSITSNPDIDFYYLKGNHDSDNFISKLDEIPDNLKLFSNQWTSYSYGNITITGLEIDKSNQAAMYNSLVLDNDNYNVVTLHGQLGDEISTGDLKNKGIDYLALGHVHEYQSGQLDNRGMYCYSGCLEGRGFDEEGDKGIILGEVSLRVVDLDFIKTNKREYFLKEIDISNCKTKEEVIDKILNTISKESREKNLFKIILKGNIEESFKIDSDLIENLIRDKFFYCKIVNSTRMKIDIDEMSNEYSIKGIFCSLIKDALESNEEDEEILDIAFRIGMESILDGEVNLNDN